MKILFFLLNILSPLEYDQEWDTPEKWQQSF